MSINLEKKSINQVEVDDPSKMMIRFKHRKKNEIRNLNIQYKKKEEN
jgi:hypothetical protein